MGHATREAEQEEKNREQTSRKSIAESYVLNQHAPTAKLSPAGEAAKA
jgi:hypothetical protein